MVVQECHELLAFDVRNLCLGSGLGRHFVVAAGDAFAEPKHRARSGNLERLCGLLGGEKYFDFPLLHHVDTFRRTALLKKPGTFGKNTH